MKMQSMAGFKRGAQAGFTLIELVVVIVILGILAATALPKFVDLSGDAYAAAAQGIAGGLSSGNAVNVAGCAVKNNVPGSSCVTVTKCSEVGKLISPALTITPGALPTPTTTAKSLYILTANDKSVTSATAKNGTTETCSAVYGDGSAAGVAFTYSATGAGN